jgi:hypothetical protein
VSGDDGIGPPERAPVGALAGGYGGLIPFAAGALGACWAPTAPLAVPALTTYAAVILAFVGAVHWGVAVARPTLPGRDRIVLASVVPALIAWPLLLLPPAFALPGLALAFLTVRLVEVRTSGAWLPPWYGRLRSHLTAGAVASLFVGWVGAGLHVPGP